MHRSKKSIKLGYRRAKLTQLLRDVKWFLGSTFPPPFPGDAKARDRALQNVYVVAHTHWDREWYKTFEDCRAILIPLMNGLMELLEAQPDFRSFTFDGQVAPIDDFLNTLPNAELDAATKRLSTLIAAGRLQIGPWYTLSDQFLVSGETTLRNLQLGIHRATQLGQVMNIAYCPDQFGMVQELPKILNKVGINRAIGERGMSRQMPRQFKWQTADGSTVDMFNLKDGYFHKQAGVRTFRNLARKFRGRSVLFLDGYDYSVPTIKILRAVQKAKVKLTSLPEFWKVLDFKKTKDIFLGEIRSVGNKNLLPNVISNRVDQRYEVACAERQLERYAEPLAALILKEYPKEILDKAWKLQIWNAAHDSACATGIDAVTAAVRDRAANTIRITSSIKDKATKDIGAKLKLPGTYVWNPSNFPRDFWFDDIGKNWLAKKVPPLGWSRASQDSAPKVTTPDSVSFRYTSQGDHGDTYTFSPHGKEHPLDLPTRLNMNPGESFVRLRVSWVNEAKNHRVRIVIKLPDIATKTISDTAFGSVVRPTIPDLIQGRDRLNGYPAGKFIIAGGLAILLERMAEYELLPGTNELAITLIRAHGALSVLNPKYRLMRAGPMVATHDTQMLKRLEWELGILNWQNTDELPWKEWEQFALPPIVFHSSGGGELGEEGSLTRDVPSGVLSAVLPEGIRTFAAGGDHNIDEHPLVRLFK